MDRLICKIETNDWVLEIAGRIPTIPSFIVQSANSTIEISGTANINVYDRVVEQLIPIAAGTGMLPLFFENTRYDFYFSNLQGKELQFFLPPAASFRHQKGTLTHYSLDFQNDIGYVEIEIKGNVEPVTIRFEVFPYKIDYRTDYVQMRDEIASIARNLTMAIQTRTFGFAVPFKNPTPTITEWISLIRHYYKELIAIILAIEQNPHSKIVKETKNISIERARHINERLLDRQLRVSKEGSTFKINRIDRMIPRKVPIAKHRITFDTIENQYIKTFLTNILHNLQIILQEQIPYGEGTSISAELKFYIALRPEAEMMRRELQNIIKMGFLREVTNTRLQRPNSLVLHRHPQYAAFERVAKMLNGGLSLDGGILRIGVKNVALLYEYWCFLKLVSILGEIFQLEQQSIIKIRHDKTIVSLQKGQQASIRFYAPKSGKTLSIIYNRFFTSLPTIAQRPDNVIQIASDEKLYIFDAKYRVSFDESYQKQYRGIGPVIEDINTMHRYRDAIVVQDKIDPTIYRKGLVQSAIILFPYNDESQYINQRFYESIKQVQIGALPFLPQTTSLVKAFLENILKKEGIITD